MSNSYTTTETFTRTNARHLASKVAGDLRLMQLYYGKPSDEAIDQYLEEIIVLLLEDCLKSVTYGFKKNGEWLMALNYNAYSGNIESADNRSGGVYPGADLSDAVWGSYLNTNSKYANLPSSEKSRIDNLITLKRTGSGEPPYSSSGKWADETKSYYSGGNGLNRKLFIPN